MNSSKYSVNVTKPPSYIRALTNSDEEIILVYSKVNNYEDLNESLSISPKSEERGVESMLDVTGSPLKYSFDNSAIMCMSILDTQQNNWLKEEEKHYPLTIEEARKFITNYLSKNINSKRVWCVCDGQDHAKTVLLSAHQKRNYIARSTVTICGYQPVAFTQTEVLSMSKTIYMPGSQRKKQSSLFFQIFGSRIRDDNKDTKNQAKGCVTLEIRNNVTKEGILTVQALVGHPDALSSFFWRDLVLLELYINTLSQYRSQEMRDSDWLPISSSLSPEEDLVELSVRTAHIGGWRAEPMVDQVQDLHKILVTVGERSTLDVTDHLWDVLVHCSTYGKLLDCLNAFVFEVAYNQGKVYVAEGNKCFMAELLRGISAGKMAVPTFTGTQPIEILIQLGIEKLRKDYIHVCNLGGIADESDINDLFKFKTKKDVEKDINSTTRKTKSRMTMLIMPKEQVVNLEIVEAQMRILGQLETLLELLLLVPSNWLQWAAPAAISHLLGPKSPVQSFNALANNRLHQLTVKLPTNAVQQHIAGTEPVSCYYSVINMLPWQKVESTLHQSLQPIFPPCIYKIDSAIDSTTDSTQLCYYYTSLLNVTNIFLHNR